MLEHVPVQLGATAEREVGLLEDGERALRAGIEAADRLELVVEELEPQRLADRRAGRRRATSPRWLTSPGASTTGHAAQAGADTARSSRADLLPSLAPGRSATRARRSARGRGTGSVSAPTPASSRKLLLAGRLHAGSSMRRPSASSRRERPRRRASARRGAARSRFAEAREVALEVGRGLVVGRRSPGSAAGRPRRGTTPAAPRCRPTARRPRACRPGRSASSTRPVGCPAQELAARSSRWARVLPRVAFFLFGLVHGAARARAKRPASLRPAWCGPGRPRPGSWSRTTATSNWRSWSGPHARSSS